MGVVNLDDPAKVSGHTHVTMGVLTQKLGGQGGMGLRKLPFLLSPGPAHKLSGIGPANPLGSDPLSWEDGKLLGYRQGSAGWWMVISFLEAYLMDCGF